MSVRELLDHTGLDIFVFIEDAAENLLTSGLVADLAPKYLDYEVGYFLPTMFRERGVFVSSLLIRI